MPAYRNAAAGSLARHQTDLSAGDRGGTPGCPALRWAPRLEAWGAPSQRPSEPRHECIESTRSFFLGY
jgi:hypothetical protein